MDQLTIIRAIDRILTPIYKNLPYSHYGLTLKLLGQNNKTLLDAACGDGQFMAMINYNCKYIATGADLFPPYLKKAAATGVYSKLVKADLRKLPFKSRSFDVVMCSQAIEHLTKKEGFALMKSLEKLAKKRLLIITPGGEMPQDAYDGNIYQKHKSQWSAYDFTSNGFHVTGQGLKFLYGTGNAVKTWGLLSYIFSLISLLAGPLLAINPDLGVYLFCWKDINGKKK